ncbi:MAG TPA: TVP38/TMEM64 family protein [Leptolyngbyaceae cyanobacterium M33_DOE_097]|uniref:TVP38/TMEM64 family membrane protein n=1 Tax=Oscillatoriales cyanobacterium SpSt-418 TaxID=2282169 RepID=A0A7C3KGN0_9CYAN|nr:TVP38/TMEM64 family protein [Leptolyngbyaceae cyanobacterium M33_DOE_097]
MPSSLKRLQKRLFSRRFLIVFVWIAAILVYGLSPLRFLLNRETLVAFLQTLGLWSPILFAGLYSVSMVIGFPTVIFTIAGGAVFGLFWGTVYSVVGATLGAMGAFWLSRYLLRRWAERRFGSNPTLQKFQQGIVDRTFLFVMAVRFIPVTPFNLENYLFGLTLANWRPYLLGTVVGIIPGTIAYTWVGVTGAIALEGGSAVSFFVAVSFLLILSALPLIVGYWRDRW